MHLSGHVVPAALRVRVAMGRSTLTLTPWLSAGWVPGQAPQPRPAATPLPTSPATLTRTRTATPTLAPMATPSPSPSHPATSTPPHAPTATPSPSHHATSTPPDAPTATNTPLPPTATSTATPSSDHAIKTVFLIVMENHNWSSIQGNTRQAPYINSLLAGAGSSQTSYA